MFNCIIIIIINFFFAFEMCEVLIYFEYSCLTKLNGINQMFYTVL